MKQKNSSAFLRFLSTVCLGCFLAGCASTPEQRAADEQRRAAEQQRKIADEQARWQRILAPYSDEQLRFKLDGLEQAITRGKEGMNILLAQGNGLGVLIAQGQIEEKVRERDAVGLELVRRGAGTSKPPPSSIPPGNDGTRPKGTGSGFFIAEDGYLLTNFHVVENASAVKVKYEGQIRDATLVRKDKGADLAVLRVPCKSTPLPFGESQKMKVGERVFTLGFPLTQLQGEEPKFTDGSISSLTGFQDDAGSFQISVPIQPGNSGGPLVNSSGQLIGVIVSRITHAQNVNYAIKADRARLLVGEISDVKIQVAEPTVALDPTEVAKRLRESAVWILVY